MEWVYVVSGIVGGAFAAGVPLYLKLRQGVADIRKQERDAVEGEFVRAIERLNRDITARDARIASLETRIEKAEAEHDKCFQDSAAQKARIEILTFQVGQLQRIASSASVAMTATVTADLSGTIVDADDSVKDVLGWRAAELIGRNVDVIIPRDLRGRHHAGLERARTAGGMVRPPELAIQSYARNAAGERVPVIVSLTGWKDENGRSLVTAQIVHRKVFAVVESVGSADDSGGVALPPAETPPPPKSGPQKRPPNFGQMPPPGGKPEP